MTMMKTLDTTTTSSTEDKIISDLRPFDVLCGRDKQSYHNIGNRRFRIMINMNLQKYIRCETRTERTRMIQALTDELQQSCGQFRFLKRIKDTNKSDIFVELNPKQSREKIAHALRDAAAQYRIMERKRRMACKLKAKSEMPPPSKIHIPESLATFGRRSQSLDQLLRSSLLIFQNDPAEDDALSQIYLSDIFD